MSVEFIRCWKYSFHLLIIVTIVDTNFVLLVKSLSVMFPFLSLQIVLQYLFEAAKELSSVVFQSNTKE